MKPQLTTLIVVLSCTISIAQRYESIGSQSESLGHAVHALESPWGLFNNPATTNSSQIKALISYRKSWLHSSFDQLAIGGLLPQSIHILGLGIVHTGDELFGWTSTQLLWKSRINKMNISVRPNFHMFRQSELENIHFITLDGGFYTNWSETIAFGFTIRNIHTSSKNYVHIPLTLGCGIRWSPVDELHVQLDFNQYDQNGFQAGMGLSYELNGSLVWNSGISYIPARFFNGVEVHLTNLSIYFAFNYQPYYGTHTQLSMDHNF